MREPRVTDSRKYRLALRKRRLHAACVAAGLSRSVAEHVVAIYFAKKISPAPAQRDAK